MAWKRSFRLPDIKAYLKSFQISPNWTLTEPETYDVFHESLTSQVPFWLFLFPEVDVLTDERIEEVSNNLSIFSFYPLTNVFFICYIFI